jgi:hypothetical protein
MKYAAIVFSLTITALTTVGMAQTSHTRSSSDDPGAAAATRPLTPKSAMPQPHKSSTVASPKAAGHNTNAELNRLERQNIKAANPHGGKTNSVAPKARNASAGKNSDINFAYQKPKTAKVPASSAPKSSNNMPRAKGN